MTLSFGVASEAEIQPIIWGSQAQAPTNGATSVAVQFAMAKPDYLPLPADTSRQAAEFPQAGEPRRDSIVPSRLLQLCSHGAPVQKEKLEIVDLSSRDLVFAKHKVVDSKPITRSSRIPD